MTLASTASKTIQEGNGATTMWPFSFPIPNQDSLQVVFVDANGVETNIPSGQYSVTGLGSSSGGSVTYPLSGSPIATGTELMIKRVVPLTQTTQYTNQGPYLPKTIEDRLDYQTMIDQQLQEQFSRSLSLPSSSLVNPALTTPQADEFLVSDPSGTGLQWRSISSLYGLIVQITSPGAIVSNMTALRLTVGQAGIAVYVVDYAVLGDHGGGWVEWDASSVLTDNGVTVFKPTSVSGAGRWIRVLNGPITPEQAGADRTGTNESSTAFESIIAAGLLEVRLTEVSQYKLIRTLSMPEGMSIHGIPQSLVGLALRPSKILWRPTNSDVVCIRNVSGKNGQILFDLQIDIQDSGHSGIAFLNSYGNVVRRVEVVGTFDIGIYLNNTYVCQLDELVMTAAAIKRACVYVYDTNSTRISRLHTSCRPADNSVRLIGIALHGGAGTVIDQPVLQGQTVGMMFLGPRNTEVNNPYFENTLCNFITGGPGVGSNCVGTIVTGGNFSGPYSGHPQYAARGPVIYMPSTDDITFNSPNIESGSSVADPTMTAFLSDFTTASVNINCPHWYQSDLRTDFMMVASSNDPKLYATGIKYDATYHAKETISKCAGAFGGKHYGVRVDSSGTLSTVVFTPTVFGYALDPLISDPFPAITSL